MFKHKVSKEPKETKPRNGDSFGKGTLVTTPATPPKPAPDKGSIVQGAKSLDFEELVTHRYESFEGDIKALIAALEDYHKSMVHQRKARTKAFEKLEVLSKHTPLFESLPTGKKSAASVSKSVDRVSRQQEELFEDNILDYIKEWNDIVSYKFENEMKEMKEYKQQKIRRKQEVKQLRTHHDKMLSVNKEKAESEEPKLNRKEEKLEVAIHRYEKHKKVLTQIIDELIDGSWKDLYPLMANLHQLEMDTANKKASILSGLQASIDKMANITVQEGSSANNSSSNATMWRSLRTDWLNTGPKPTVPTADEPKPMAAKTEALKKDDRAESEERNDEDKLSPTDEHTKGEREDAQVVFEADESKDKRPDESQKDQPDKSQDEQLLLHPYVSQNDQRKKSLSDQPFVYDPMFVYPKDQPKELQNEQPNESQPAVYEAQNDKTNKSQAVVYEAQNDESNNDQSNEYRSDPAYVYKGRDDEPNKSQPAVYEARNDEPELNESQKEDPQDKQTGLVGAITSYFQGEHDETTDFQNEQPEDSRDKQPIESQNYKPVVYEAETDELNKSQNAHSNENRIDQPVVYEAESQSDKLNENRGDEAFVYKDRDDEPKESQPDESHDKQPGLVGAITSYFQGDTDEPVDSQKEQLTSAQNAPPEVSHDKKPGMLSSIASSLRHRGKSDEKTDPQSKQMSDSQGEQVTDSQSKSSGLYGSTNSNLQGKDEPSEPQNEHVVHSYNVQVRDSQDEQVAESLNVQVVDSQNENLASC